MNNFKKILQDELKRNGRLTINQVMNLCYQHNHFYDTARRHLEEDKTPFSKKLKGIKNRIAGWEYKPEQTTLCDQ